MKIDFLALYQRSLLGGIGGLLGWALITLLVPSSTNFGVQMLTGGLIGLALGAMCGCWEGIFRDRSAKRVLVGIGIGAGIGCLGGIFGLMIGQALYSTIGKGIFIRAIGWGIFGAVVGINEGIAKRMPMKMLYGGYGGLLGGLIGGSTYEGLALALQNMESISRATAGTLGKAIGLVLLGMFIGLMVGLVEDLLRSAWLLFTSGRLEGQTRTLDPSKSKTTLGRNEMADICLLGDPKIAMEHARLVFANGTFVIEAVDGPVTAGGAGAMTDVRRYPLQSGDYIQLGGNRAVFQMGKVKS